MRNQSPVLSFYVVSLALILSSVALAQTDSAENDQTKPESPVVLPAPVQKNNLLPFYVSPTTTMDFAVDAKSLSVTDEGIVRFTIVISNASGASNISYEGIRCSTGEKKIYATNQANGGWSLSRRDIWEPIIDRGANRHHAALAKDYFCNSGFVDGKAEVIVDRLRKKKTLR